MSKRPQILVLEDDSHLGAMYPAFLPDCAVYCFPQPDQALGFAERNPVDLAIIVADGLSATAIHSQAVPLLAPAGSMSFHHIRLVHGSATNTSDRPRRLLLFEAQAADAWPLMGVPDFDAFNRMLICGEPTITPRLADVPLRMPLPPSPRPGSIYENQTMAKRKWFEGAPAD